MRAESYYDAAHELMPYLDADGVKIYGTMIDIYHALLVKIRDRDGDVFAHRVRLSAWHKAALALRNLRPRWSRLGATFDKPPTVRGIAP